MVLTIIKSSQTVTQLQKNNISSHFFPTKKKHLPCKYDHHFENQICSTCGLAAINPFASITVRDSFRRCQPCRADIETI